MRRLLLLRHAKSDWPDGISDPDRPLSERGIRDAPRMGAYMAEKGLLPGLALISPARRTQDTWELVASAFNTAHTARIESLLYAAPARTILEVVRTAPAPVETLLVVGHNPGLEMLARSFAASGDSDAIRRIGKKYPTAGLSVIELPIDDWKAATPPAGRLEQFVTPKSLES